MKAFVNIRNSEELQHDLAEARRILGVDERLHGADPETVRRSLRFVIESHHYLWEQFNTQNGPLVKEYIKGRLLNG